MQVETPDIAFKLPPRTALEVFEMLPEGTLAEVIDNTIYMAPSPDVWHQRTSITLASSMHAYVITSNLGMCLAAPMDVYLNDRNVVQPDILFISNAKLGIISKDGKIKGIPDLVVEILSGNHKHDTKTKKELYETFGVKEYFIVNPDAKEVITYYNNNGSFVKQANTKGVIISQLLGKEFEF